MVMLVVQVIVMVMGIGTTMDTGQEGLMIPQGRHKPVFQNIEFCKFINNYQVHVITMGISCIVYASYAQHCFHNNFILYDIIALILCSSTYRPNFIVHYSNS